LAGRRPERLLPVATSTGISSRPSKDSDGAEEQKRNHGEHHQMPRLKQIKQMTHSDTLRAIAA